MTSNKIPPLPEATPKSPDKATKKNPDYTGDNASGRVFFINFWIFKFGTEDKAHGAAVLFSILLLALIAIISVLGAFIEISSERLVWLDTIFTWLSSAFLFVSGVAVGRSKTDESAD